MVWQTLFHTNFSATRPLNLSANFLLSVITSARMNDSLASWIFTSTPFYFIKTIFMHCGEIFKILRNWKKISQQQLAKKLNTSQQYISALEKQEHLSGEKLTMLLKGINSTREEWERFKKLTPHPLMKTKR